MKKECSYCGCIHKFKKEFKFCEKLAKLPNPHLKMKDDAYRALLESAKDCVYTENPAIPLSKCKKSV